MIIKKILSIAALSAAVFSVAHGQYLNEFAGNPAGSDPAEAMIELAGGTPSAAFDLWILSIENDGFKGNVDRVNNVAGTFDADGMAVVVIGDLENPSFTLVLTTAFTGNTSTDIDPLDDGTLDLSSMGTILDAVGVSDNVNDDPALYGELMGGENVLYNGQFEPLIVFRDSMDQSLYQNVTVNFGSPEEYIGVYTAMGEEVDASMFDIDPTGDTFGSVNPSYMVTPPPMDDSQYVLTQWNANDNSSGASFYGASAGVGTASGYNQGNPSLPFAGFGAEPLISGSNMDPGSQSGDYIRNLAYIVNPPLTSTLNNTVGTKFMTSTEGVTGALTLSWSQAVGYRASRYYQILVTVDGENWAPVESGTGSAVIGLVNGLNKAGEVVSGTAAVLVDDNGFIDFRTIGDNYLTKVSTSTGPIENYSVGFVDGITLTLPAGVGYEDNPNFGFAIVGSYDPTVGGEDGTLGYISSFYGLDSTDEVDGYNRSSSRGGSMRLDLVTVVASDGPPPVIWAGYEVDEFSDTDTGGFLGWINVGAAPYVWSYSLQNWMYLPENHVEEYGAWAFHLK